MQIWPSKQICVASIVILPRLNNALCVCARALVNAQPPYCVNYSYCLAYKMTLISTFFLADRQSMGVIFGDSLKPSHVATKAKGRTCSTSIYDVSIDG